MHAYLDNETCIQYKCHCGSDKYFTCINNVKYVFEIIVVTYMVKCIPSCICMYT